MAYKMEVILTTYKSWDDPPRMGWGVVRTSQNSFFRFPTNVRLVVVAIGMFSPDPKNGGKF